MPPRPISPAATADQKAERQQKETERAATPPPPPPPKDIYATLAGTLAHPMDAEQYYQSVQRELPADHATLQGWRQEKANDNEWGTEDDLLWEDTPKGTMDTFLEAAAATYPCPPGYTRHGLHALLAFHSWKHRHTITLHPLDHDPHRWTPGDDASAAITIQQDPGNPSGYHITWNDLAPHPPASPTLQDFFATISAELQQAEAPQQPDDVMPQAPSPPTAKESPRKEPLTHPITTMELPPTATHHLGPQRASGLTARMGGPQRHAPVGRNHTGAPGHPPPLNQRTHHHLDTTGGPPPPPPHCPTGCHHHTNGGRSHNSRPRPDSTYPGKRHRHL